MENIKAVLFDMDGVLIDSEVLMLKSAMGALRDFGIETKPEDFTEYVGAGEDKFVGGVAEKYGRKYDLAMKARTYEIYGECVATEAFVPKGVADMLRYIKKKGYKMAVCSSADRIKVEYNLHAIGISADTFDFIATGSDVKRKKPFPDIYLAAASAFGAAAQECVVVEDAINGILAAKSGGMHSIAITSSLTRGEFMSRVSPDIVIDDIRSLMDIL